MKYLSTSELPATMIELVQAGLLQIGDGCHIHPTVLFMPQDLVGTRRQVILGHRVTVGAFAIVHGGAHIGDGSTIGHRVTVGEPEYGYAVRQFYPGEGAVTEIGSGVVLRGAATLYAGVTIGNETSIGHNTVLRTNVKVGSGSQLGANLTVERGCVIGDRVRCSPGSHLTAATMVEDRVFLGAGVRTINDKQLIWRDPAKEQPLMPPSFAQGCKVGSGAVILAGIRVGTCALVGAGPMVTRDVRARAIVYGVPAAQHGEVCW